MDFGICVGSRYMNDKELPNEIPLLVRNLEDIYCFVFSIGANLPCMTRPKLAPTNMIPITCKLLQNEFHMKICVREQPQN